MKKLVQMLSVVLLASVAGASCFINVNKACPASMALSNPPYSCTGTTTSGPYPFTDTARTGWSDYYNDNTPHCFYSCTATDESGNQTTTLTGYYYTGARVQGTSCVGS
jgi:hypothetical protein